MKNSSPQTRQRHGIWWEEINKEKKIEEIGDKDIIAFYKMLIFSVLKS
jgi:hypothetical protein